MSNTPHQVPFYEIAILGAGAAGLFTAALLSETGLGPQAILLERTQKSGAKILVSGGGRCNVTHHCYDPKELVKNYPRGNLELLGPFSRFGPKEMVNFLESRGVDLKTEEDGRIFPQSDQSQTIHQTFLKIIEKGKLPLQFGVKLQRIEEKEGLFHLVLEEGEIVARNLILATGSHPSGLNLAASLGHSLTKRVPSLFSFHIKDFNLAKHAGISFEATGYLGKSLETQGKAPKIEAQKGPLLITHSGFSGPCILKLSAWQARFLHSCNYQCELFLDFLPSYEEKELLTKFQKLKEEKSSLFLPNSHLIPLPRNLLETTLKNCKLDSSLPIGRWSHGKFATFLRYLKNWRGVIEGQSTHKAEFVTCGGIDLKEIDFKRFESRKRKRLFFAGEILDIDAVTGGFNFQNAWTGAWHIAQALKGSLLPR